MLCSYSYSYSAEKEHQNHELTAFIRAQPTRIIDTNDDDRFSTTVQVGHDSELRLELEQVFRRNQKSARHHSRERRSANDLVPNPLYAQVRRIVLGTAAVCGAGIIGSTGYLMSCGNTLPQALGNPLVECTVLTGAMILGMGVAALEAVPQKIYKPQPPRHTHL